MSKPLFFFSVLLCTIIIASCYGILHDQVTYTISPEYYTRFKFIQFGLVDEGVNLPMNHRLAAMIVGIMATWWVGLTIGLFYAGILSFFEMQPGLYRLYFKTVALTFGIAALFGITGFLYGRFHLIATGVSWHLPEQLADKSAFICVGSIHNYSYMGGIAGCMAGILFLLYNKTRLKYGRNTTI